MVLAVLCETPAHPYGIQRLIKDRGKEHVVNISNRNSIYQTIERLHRIGLIAIRETDQLGSQRPDRTIYEITKEGRETATRWLEEMLATPAPDFSEFPAALSLLPLSTPDIARTHLEHRLRDLDAEWKRIEAERTAYPDLPRLFLVELEYQQTLISAQREFVHCLISDLRAGTISWNEDWLRSVAAMFATDQNVANHAS